MNGGKKLTGDRPKDNLISLRDQLEQVRNKFLVTNGTRNL